MVAILFTCILCWIWLQILISELVSSAFNGINSIEYFGLKKYTCFYKQTKQIHNNGQQQTHPLNMVNNQHSHLPEMHPVQYIQAHKMFKLSISIRFHRLRLCFHAFYHMQDFKRFGQLYMLQISNITEHMELILQQIWLNVI